MPKKLLTCGEGEPPCTYKADSPRSLGLHKRKKHGIPGKFADKNKKPAGYKPRRKLYGSGSHGSKIPDQVIGYAFGCIETWLEVYARSVGVDEGHLTRRVAELLRSKG